MELQKEGRLGKGSRSLTEQTAADGYRVYVESRNSGFEGLGFEGQGCVGFGA